MFLQKQVPVSLIRSTASLLAVVWFPGCVLVQSIDSQPDASSSQADTNSGSNQDVEEDVRDVENSDASDVLEDSDGVDSDCESAPFEPVGVYLLGVNIFPLDRRDEHPLLLSTEVVADGFGTYTFTFQPLATDDIIADDGSRTPRTDGARTPVGIPVVVNNVAIAADMSFSLTVPSLRILGEANSLTGRDLLADINLVDASFRDSNFACGNVTGQASEPISLSLAPSTFALQRATEFNSAVFLADACSDAGQVPVPAEICE